MKRLLDSLPRLGLSTWILIGLCAGIVVGLMFGESCASLKIVGDAFIRLLQMTILPFIVVSIIKGIGSLSVETARQLFARAGLLLLLFWGIALGIVFLLPFAFPEIESGSFFSAAMVRAPETVDFLELYIPANPFSSLTNNFVPAVVLFSISLGVALIGVKDKGVLLETLTALSDALVRVAKFVVWLTPIGVFGITASAAGTMTIQELSRLQVYFVTFNLAVLLLTFWVLPMLVSVTTPVRYYDVIRFSRVTLLTAFATDNLFIVLPLIMVNCVEIFEHYELRTPNTRAFIEVIAPVSFNFPNVATLLNLLFILFAGWFTGSTLGPGDLPRFAVSGTLSMFGGAALAIPYMLDAFRLPADLFQLYLVAGIVNSRSATMLAAMSLFSFTIISTAAMTGIMKVKWRRLAANTLAIIAALVVCLIGARTLLDRTCAGQSNLAESVRQMRLLMHPSPTTVYRTIPERVLSDDDVVAPQLRIREGGTLRVGYIANRLPYSFFNRRDELVGFDIDLVHLLADEVDCSVEFIPCDYAILPDQLDAGLFDFAVSGLPVTTESLTRMRFSDAYLEVTLALIVPDHLRQEFATMDKIRKMERVRIGVPPGSYFRKKLAKALPNAELVEIPTMRSHFEGNADVDAILADAEGGAAWTLLHPGFHVVIPEPTNVGQPLAFAVRQGNEEFVTFLSDWIKLKRSTREIDALYDHWILGRGAERREPRWCLIRDVLHWVD